MVKRILTQIWIYPIKSLGGIRLKSARVMEKGLQFDRRWMLVDENNVFMTQRVCPKMALIRLKIKNTLNGEFEVVNGHESISIVLTESVTGPPIHTKVFDDEVTVFEVSEEYSRWFTEQLGLKCKLVSFPENGLRPVDPNFKINDEQVSLADGYPLLIVGQSSLDDLNSRLENQVPMNRFRPNLVFTGGDAFEEDQWRNFTVGKNRFVGVKPCGRCIITTTDQESGERSPEPLLTLSKYRTKDGKVRFGQNVIAIDKDEIHEGDEIIFR